MAITPVQYDLAPGWTQSDFADGLESTLLQAGFAAADIYKDTNYPGCVWKTTHGSGTYSSTYQQILTNNGQVYFRRFGNVDLTSGAILGDQYLDWYASSLSNTSSTWSLCDYTNVSNAFFRCWTSAIDTDFSVIEFHNGANQFVFFCVPNNATMNSWVNFNERSFNPVYFPAFYSTGYWMRFNCLQNCFNRRDVQMGSGAAWTSSSYPTYQVHSQYAYLLHGQYVGNSSSSTPYNSGNQVWDSNNNAFCHTSIPTATDNQIPSLTDDYMPMIKGMPYSGYTTHTLPADFGVVPISTNGLSAGDKFVVSSGVEEYEALTVRNHSGSGVYTSGAFVARIV